MTEAKNEGLAIVPADIRKKIAGAMKAVFDMEITSQEDMAKASELQVNLKKLQKFVTQEKKKRLDPAQETVKLIKADWAVYEDQVDEALGSIQTALIGYHDKEEEKRKKKEEAIVARAESGNIKESTAVRKLDELGEEKKTMHTGEGSVTFTKIKQVRIIKREIVPEQYWVLDMVEVRRSALALSREKNKIGELIPGVEVYEETNTNTRA